MELKGINAGDPLIDTIKNIFESETQSLIELKETKLSGAKKGDGDLYTTNLYSNIAIDGKYKIEAPKNPKILSNELNKISNQAKNHNRLGMLATNYIYNDKEEICITMKLEDFIKMLIGNSIIVE